MGQLNSDLDKQKQNDAGGPNPEKVGREKPAPSPGGAQNVGGPQFRAFCSLSRHPKPSGFHTTARNLKRTHLRVPALQKHHQNSTRRPPREGIQKEHCGRRGKKTKFWAVRRREVRGRGVRGEGSWGEERGPGEGVLAQEPRDAVDLATDLAKVQLAKAQRRIGQKTLGLSRPPPCGHVCA